MTPKQKFYAEVERLNIDLDETKAGSRWGRSHPRSLLAHAPAGFLIGDNGCHCNWLGEYENGQRPDYAMLIDEIQLTKCDIENCEVCEQGDAA
jgi:hypothetical protein